MCPICKGNEHSFVGIPRVNSKFSEAIRHDYKIVQCTNCEMYYVDPEIDLSNEEWRVLYNEEYFPQMSNWYEKNRGKDRSARFNNLEIYVPFSEKNFLDVGCGEGHCLIEAMRRGWRVHGVDITDNRIPTARDSSIKFYQSNLINCHFPDNFFHIIYMDSVLEHVINPFEYLLEIKRILTKSGVVYIGVPNEDSLLNDVRKIFYSLKASDISPKLKPFETPYHVVGFNEKSMHFMLGSAQLGIKQIRNFACRLEFLRAKPFSKTFFQSLLLLPIYLLAVPMRKEVYLEVYAQNK